MKRIKLQKKHKNKDSNRWLNRHLNDEWDQIKIAKYLENLGYSLFLVGSEEWLPITSDFFRVNNNPLILDEGYGPFIQGNALALHSEYESPIPSAFVSFAFP